MVLLRYNIAMAKQSEKNRECPFRKNHTLCTSQIRLFQPLPLDVQEMLVSESEHRTYKKGEEIAHVGDSIEEVIIIREGRVKTCQIDASGDEYIMDILHESQAIWHDMFLKDHTYHYSIIALSEVTVCTIKRQTFMQMLGKYPTCAMSLIAMLSTELQEAKEKAQLLSIRQPLTRLAGFLLNKDQTCTNHEIKMKLDDIAASIGLRPETVSRCISKLENEHLIERLGQGKLKVIDQTNLLELYISGKNI